MKGIVLALLLITGFSVYSNAQSTAAQTKKPATTTIAKPETAKATPATTHTKKDGTPDKRYKENRK